jgi:hypothetical protein
LDEWWLQGRSSAVRERWISDGQKCKFRAVSRSTRRQCEATCDGEVMMNISEGDLATVNPNRNLSWHQRKTKMNSSTLCIRSRTAAKYVERCRREWPHHMSSTVSTQLSIDSQLIAPIYVFGSVTNGPLRSCGIDRSRLMVSSFKNEIEQPGSKSWYLRRH